MYFATYEVQEVFGKVDIQQYLEIFLGNTGRL